MDRQRVAHILNLGPILHAYIEGKTIQVQTDPGVWADIEEPEFNDSPENYRIKPEEPEFQDSKDNPVNPTKTPTKTDNEIIIFALLLSEHDPNFTKECGERGTHLVQEYIRKLKKQDLLEKVHKHQTQLAEAKRELEILNGFILAKR